MHRWSVRRLLTVALATLIVIFVLTFAADWLQLQLRRHQGSAYGSVMVESTDVVREKGNKVEFYSNPPQPTPCVHAIFPHEGQPACWWLARHIDEQRYLN